MNSPALARACLVSGLAVLVIGLQAWGFHGLRHDDAYITFRYAANLATGHGLVFNPGEQLMGSTSPGQALIGALIYPLVGHAGLPGAMAVLGCVAWTLQAAAVFAILDGPLKRAGAAFVALAIAAGAAWSHRFLALETNLVAAALLGAMAAGIRGRWLLSASLCAVAGILRPDAYVAVLPLGLLCLRELGRAAWRPAALGALLSAPWYLFAYTFYGTILPQSASAKVGAERMLVYGGRGLRYVTTNTALPFLRYDFEGPGTWVLSIAVLSAACAGAFILARRAPRTLVLPVYAAALFIAYVRMRPQPGLEWHLYPVLLTVTVLVLVALAALGEGLAQRLGRAPVLCLAVLIVGALSARTVLYAQIHERAYWYGARDRVYREIAEHIRARSNEGDWITSIEVGTLAYYADLPVLDLAGLVTRDPGDALPTTPHRWLVDVPAYPPYYDAVRAAPPFVTVASGEIAREELHFQGEEQFIAVVEDRSQRDL